MLILAPIGCGPIHANLLCRRVCKSIRFVISVRTLSTWSALDRQRTRAADPTFPHALKAVAYVELDQQKNADAEMRSALGHRPELNLGHFHSYQSFRDQTQRERFSQASLQAGLPG